MKLTPLDVRKQEFGRALRGYDPDEVRSFLESLSEEYEAALTDRQRLAKRVELLEAKLEDYTRMEQNLKSAMMDAQRAGKVAEFESHKQAELHVQEARLEAEQIMAEARRKKQNLLDDVARLEGQRRAFILKMKQILRGQVELLELLEDEMLEKALNDQRPSNR